MKTKANISIRIIPLLSIFLIILGSNLKAENLQKLVNLEGSWKFSIGDNSDWLKPSFNDSEWGSVIAPRSWEANGFENYNGFAWYRKQFEWNENLKQGYVILRMGKIDDADEVYINGHLVGSSGKMMPKPESAFDVSRKYVVPVSILKAKNTIAVRVYDYYLDGGIVDGPLGIYSDKQNDLLEMNLSGYWYFETEEEIKQRKLEGGKLPSNRVFVPATWESQGYSGYDGKAIYKTKFTLPKKLANDNLVLVLGFIDDVEVIYINKEKIGSIISYEKKERTGLSYHLIFRGYDIPLDCLNVGGDNLITVVVHDEGGFGGIYDGPIGITTRDKFERLKELNFKYQSTFEIFINSFNR